MPTDLFVGCRAKIDRAKFHLKQLTLEIRAAEGDMYGFRVDVDAHTGERVIKASLPQQLFTHYSIAGGEVVHQARSALEHLIWDLILANGATPKDWVSGFPIFIDKNEYQKKSRRMVNGVNTAAITIIDGLQPVNPNYRTDILYLLGEMWNREKHRLLNFASIRLNAYKALYIYPSGRHRAIVADLTTAAVQDGTELGRFRQPDDLTPQVKVIEQVDYSGLFFKDAGSATGYPALELLLNQVNLVESITNKLIGTVVT